MSTMTPQTHRRRQVFVDAQLQGRLALALVVLEAGLLVLACAYLYHAFGEIIDESLYVIHAAERSPLLPRLATALGQTIVVCALANTAALMLADAIWGRHVRKVLAAFRKRLARVRERDLRPDEPCAAAPPRHRLLGLTERWIDSERQRLIAAREAARLLATAPTPASDALERLEAARRALPRAPRGDRN
ncbi:MAG: hypothetical protein KDG52_01560 [Rhodocyclaceae bacterium]|nr:hypothetical protein [Rhodocyclaceae bacterium]